MYADPALLWEKQASPSPANAAVLRLFQKSLMPYEAINSLKKRISVFRENDNVPTEALAVNIVLTHFILRSLWKVLEQDKIFGAGLASENTSRISKAKVIGEQHLLVVWPSRISWFCACPSWFLNRHPLRNVKGFLVLFQRRWTAWRNLKVQNRTLSYNREERRPETSLIEYLHLTKRSTFW